ncbi:hypothetical protein [Microbispora sp. NPDC049125]|uniref:peptidase MA family metallohydrolase n=1 Tax=Microbispora sp. NPDC049125 TaxID=3154929 RepID=UPI0034674930
MSQTRQAVAQRAGASRTLALLVAAVTLLAGVPGSGPRDMLLPRARAIAAERPSLWTGAFVARGEHAVVIGNPRGLVTELAALADDASRTVARVWGRPVDAVVLVPRTAEQAAELAAPARVEGMAALAGADRVIVEPSGFARLSAAGRRIVVTHELTHLATGAAVSPGMPVWLVEGFADYAGYLGSGLPVTTVAAELAADVRAGSAPRELPVRADFDAGPVRRAEAYEAAWLACRYVAGRFGERRLVALYRAAAASGLDAALRGTLGMTEAELTRSWRAYVLDQLASP